MDTKRLFLAHSLSDRSRISFAFHLSNATFYNLIIYLYVFITLEFSVWEKTSLLTRETPGGFSLPHFHVTPLSCVLPHPLLLPKSHPEHSSHFFNSYIIQDITISQVWRQFRTKGQGQRDYRLLNV